MLGPVSPATVDNKQYVVSFIDDFSKFGIIYLVEDKSEMLDCFMDYEAKVTAFHGLKISTIKCNNGGEYSSKAFQEFYQRKDIFIDYTNSYTSQQNCCVERYNRSLIEKVCCMLIGSGSPKELWGEAALTAAYRMNCSPSSGIKECFVTPTQLWYNGTKQSVENLSIFGCAAYVKIPDEKRSNRQ